jgi:hypothetical protein
MIAPKYFAQLPLPRYFKIFYSNEPILMKVACFAGIHNYTLHGKEVGAGLAQAV